jgi:hypothetical protein
MVRYQSLIVWMRRFKSPVISLVVMLATNLYLLSINMNFFTPTPGNVYTAILLNILASYTFIFAVSYRLNPISSWIHARVAGHCRLLSQRRGLLITKVFVLFISIVLCTVASFPLFRELRPKPDRWFLELHDVDSKTENGKASGIIRIR